MTKQTQVRWKLSKVRLDRNICTFTRTWKLVHINQYVLQTSLCMIKSTALLSVFKVFLIWAQPLKVPSSRCSSLVFTPRKSLFIGQLLKWPHCPLLNSWDPQKCKKICIFLKGCYGANNFLNLPQMAFKWIVSKY